MPRSGREPRIGDFLGPCVLCPWQCWCLAQQEVERDTRGEKRTFEIGRATATTVEKRCLPHKVSACECGKGRPHGDNSFRPSFGTGSDPFPSFTGELDCAPEDLWVPSAGSSRKFDTVSVFFPLADQIDGVSGRWLCGPRFVVCVVSRAFASLSSGNAPYQVGPDAKTAATVQDSKGTSAKLSQSRCCNIGNPRSRLLSAGDFEMRRLR